MLTTFKYFAAALNILNLFCAVFLVWLSLTGPNSMVIWHIFGAAINLWAFTTGWQNIKECFFFAKPEVNDGK